MNEATVPARGSGRTARAAAGPLAGAVIMALLALPAPAQTTDEEPMARVNGTPIARRVVREVVKSVVASSPEPPTSLELERLTQAALDSLIELELLYQEARARDIQISAGEVDAEIRRSRARFATAAEFDVALKREGMSEARLREETRKTLVVNRLLDQVVWRDVSVSTDAAYAFYDQNQAAFEHPAQVRLSHILIRSPETDLASTRAAARDKAKELHAQLQAGRDFARLARKYSDDARSAGDGGDLGFVDKSSLAPALAEVGLGLAPGELSSVIESADGYHLLRATARREAGVKQFSEVRERVVRLLEEEQRQHRKREFVAALREKATIEPRPAGVPTPGATP